MDLPAARDPVRPYAVALVCLGNICRSPMAQVVLEDQLAVAGLAKAVTVSSAGTGDWHLGEPMDARAAAALRAEGYDPSRHRAKQVLGSWFETNDLLLAMDRANLADLRMLAPDSAAAARAVLFRAFDPELEPALIATGGTEVDVPDPWWGGPDGFTEVLTMVRRTSAGLVRALAAR